MRQINYCVAEKIENQPDLHVQHYVGRVNLFKFNKTSEVSTMKCWTWNLCVVKVEIENPPAMNHCQRFYLMKSRTVFFCWKIVLIFETQTPMDEYPRPDQIQNPFQVGFLFNILLQWEFRFFFYEGGPYTVSVRHFLNSLVLCLFFTLGLSINLHHLCIFMY